MHAAINDPAHPEHDDMLEWVGGDFDPKEFNLDEINKRLKGLKKRVVFERELNGLLS